MPTFKSTDPVEINVAPGKTYEVRVDGVAATVASLVEEPDGTNGITEQSEGSLADGDRMAYFGAAHRLKITPASATGSFNVTEKKG